MMLLCFKMRQYWNAMRTATRRRYSGMHVANPVSAIAHQMDGKLYRAGLRQRARMDVVGFVLLLSLSSLKKAVVARRRMYRLLSSFMTNQARN
ncbi:MAG: hypothetical protein DRQ02_12940 [Candidatus Latescibacterota bacterium]|nr:MAG: hypothetical protein DRQ02_12940 [Candidatus Latescibacterota bacterium]